MFCALNQHIGMISEGSCDTKNVKIMIFHNITVFTVICLNKCSLGEHKRKRFKSKKKKKSGIVFDIK